jgi:hypothetical protein
MQEEHTAKGAFARASQLLAGQSPRLESAKPTAIALVLPPFHHMALKNA